MLISSELTLSIRLLVDIAVLQEN